MFTLKKQNSKGFTLLEMIIAMGIFIALFTLTLGIYSYAIKAEQKTIQLSQLQKEAQLVMEIIAKKIRTGRLNYSYFSVPITTPTDTLPLVDKTGEFAVFTLKSTDNSIGVCIDTSSGCDEDSEFYSIPSGNINVTDLDFFISPLIDPCSSPSTLTANPEFPTITIVLTLEHLKGQTLTIQQTVPQRLGCL